MGVTRIITMTAYENLLAIFYHGSLPFTGDQCIRVKIFDITTLRVSMDCALNISPRSELKWAGFSSNGILYVQDTKQSVWTLVNVDVWSCIY